MNFVIQYRLSVTYAVVVLWKVRRK